MQSLTLAPIRAGRPALALLFLALALLAPAIARLPTPAPLELAAPARLAAPLAFVPNQGQADPAVRMQARGLGGGLAFLPGEVALTLPTAVGAAPAKLRLQFVGGAAAEIAGAEPQPGLFHSYRGQHAAWREGLPTYAALVYRELYPGVDLRYDGRDGALKGTYTVAPGADPARIRWRYEGAEALALDAATGDLRVSVPGGQDLVERAPVAWQELGGRRVPVAARFTLEAGEAGFALGAYDRAHPLVIDPELAYATYLGGLAGDEAYGIALDRQGNIYLTGRTYSDDFPGEGGERASDRDVFVAKFDPTGARLLYSTLIGGRAGDDGEAVAVSPAGEAVVSVSTFSDDFPLKGALLDTLPPLNGALLKLDARGALAFSTYLDVNLFYAHRTLAVDGAGAIYLAGEVDGESSGRDIGVAKLSPDGARVLAETSLGGAGTDIPVALAVGPGGAIYLTGSTEAYANDFPTTAGARQPICPAKQADAESSCDRDAFLLILEPDLDVRYSSFLGGVGSDTGGAIGLDGEGNIAVAGITNAASFPTHKAVQPACPDGRSELDERWCGSFAAFVASFTPDGGGANFSTFFSSPDWSDDVVRDLALSPDGTIHILSRTNSQRYPVKSAPQPNLAAGVCSSGSERLCEDNVVMGFAPDGALRYSTYLGGTGRDYGYAIAADARGGVWVTGMTESRNFPGTAGGFQPQKSLNEDVFLARLGPASTPPPPPPGDRHRVYLPFARR